MLLPGLMPGAAYELDCAMIAFRNRPSAADVPARLSFFSAVF